MAALLLRYRDFAPGWPFHAALVAIQPGQRDQVRLHKHADFHEVVLVTEGHGTHRVAGAATPLRRGDLVLVRPHDEHEFTGSLSFINIAFPTEQWRVFTDIAGVASARDWDLQENPPVVHDTTDRLLDPFAAALAVYAKGPPRPLNAIRLWTAALDCLEQAAGADHDARPGWLVQACASFASEDNLRAGLPRLLQLAAVSHGHLARSMATFYGSTPVEFVNERRLAHASVLLTTTTEPVGTIALRCGFTSQSYFGRCFRRRYACTPREYRLRARQAVVP